ncbi:hypothetical protein CsSME_00003976 [Camellia sinensis var. sinensis]
MMLASVIDEQIEDTLFHMLDEETDTEIGNLVRSTIMRLLYASCPLCPSHWLSICRAMVGFSLYVFCLLLCFANYSNW